MEILDRLVAGESELAHYAKEVGGGGRTTVKEVLSEMPWKGTICFVDDESQEGGEAAPIEEVLDAIAGKKLLWTESLWDEEVWDFVRVVDAAREGLLQMELGERGRSERKQG